MFWRQFPFALRFAFCVLRFAFRGWPMAPVVIVGGGVAGLMAALHLAERGVRPLLLEASQQHIGGRLSDGPSIGFEHAGRRWEFPGEHGVHGIWSPYVNFTAALGRHGLLPPLVPARDE